MNECCNRFQRLGQVHVKSGKKTLKQRNKITNWISASEKFAPLQFHAFSHLCIESAHTCKVRKQGMIMIASSNNADNNRMKALHLLRSFFLTGTYAYMPCVLKTLKTREAKCICCIVHRFLVVNKFFANITLQSIVYLWNVQSSNLF